MIFIRVSEVYKTISECIEASFVAADEEIGAATLTELKTE